MSGSAKYEALPMWFTDGPFDKKDALSIARDALHEAEKAERRALLKLGTMAVEHGLESLLTVTARVGAIEARQRVIAASVACKRAYDEQAIEGIW